MGNSCCMQMFPDKYIESDLSHYLKKFSKVNPSLVNIFIFNQFNKVIQKFFRFRLSDTEHNIFIQQAIQIINTFSKIGGMMQDLEGGLIHIYGSSHLITIYVRSTRAFVFLFKIGQVKLKIEEERKLDELLETLLEGMKLIEQK